MGDDSELVKNLLPPLHEQEATVALLERLPGAKVYGLLLNANPKHPIADAISAHWSEFHHASGPDVLLVAFQPPATWSEALKEHWKKQLGKDFEKTWKQWQSVDSGAAYDYVDLFDDPRIEASAFPCLVLFTDLQERRAVVRSLPAWDSESLYKLLLAMMIDIRSCAEQPADVRFECLRKSLTSPSARARDALGHLKDKGFQYLREHPAQAVTTTVTVVLALGSAGVLPLTAAAVTVLTIVKDIFAKKKS